MNLNEHLTIDFDSMAILEFSDLLTEYETGKRHFRGVSIEHADGFECDLRDIELSEAIIDSAYLPYSNLNRANLQGIVVKQGDFGDAKLANSNLEGAQLNGVNLSRADLRYTRLCQVSLRHCNLASANLAGADLTGADLTGADLTGADLSEAQLTSACLVGATLFRACNVNISEAKCDRTTILPDGHYYP